jgi:tape measure domain-containing protein
MNDTLKLGISSEGAVEGARVYVGAINRISRAIDGLDRDGTQKLERLQRISSAGGFGGIAAAAAQISALKVSPAIARNIERLSAALSGFKGPSVQGVRRSADLYNLLVGFSRLQPNLSGLSALSGFRGVTPATVRNLQAFSTALQGVQPPTQAARIISTLNAIGRAAEGLKNLRGATNSLNAFNAGAARASSGLRGLGANFGFARSAAQLFSGTIAGVAFGAFIRQTMNAGAQLQTFRAALGAFIHDGAEVERALRAIDSTADDLGQNVAGARQEFPRLAAAILGSGGGVDDALEIYRDFSTAARVLNLDGEATQRIMTAVGQSFSKGAVRAEELQQQVGDALPGAYAMMQRALERATGRQVNLADEMQKGTISARAWILLGRELQQTYGSQVPAAMTTSRGQFQRLSNAWTDFVANVSEGGLDAGLADGFRRLTELLRSSDFQETARQLGAGLGDAARVAGRALEYLATHGSEVKAVVSTLIALQAASWAINFGAGIFTAGKQLAGFATSASRAATATGAWALRVGALEALIAGGWIAAAAAAIGVVAVAALDAGGSFDVLKNKNLEFGDVAAAVFEEIGGNIAGLASTIGDFATQTYNDHLKPFFDGFARIAGQAIGGVVEGFRWLAREAGKALQGFAEWSGWSNFWDNVGSRAEGHRDNRHARRNREALRGLSTPDALPAVTAPVNPFQPPTRDAGAGAAREARRLQDEQEKWVAKLSGAADLVRDLDEAQQMLARSTAQLAAAGLTRDRALQLSNERVAAEHGLLSDVASRYREYAQAIETARVARERGIITAAREVQIGRDAEATLRSGLGLYDETAQATSDYDTAVTSLNEVLTRSPELADAVAAATSRAAFAFREQLGAVTESQRALREYEQQLLNIRAAAAGVKGFSPGDAGIMQGRAGRAAAEGLSGASDENFDERVRGLTRLRDEGAITQQQYSNYMAEMTAVTLEFQTAAGSGSYTDQFLAGLTRMTEGARNANVVLGDLMTSAAESLSSGLGDSLARAIVYAEDLQSALYDVVNQALTSLISGLIQLGVQMLINNMISQTAQAAATASSTAAAATVASSWASAAAMTSLATFGGNAAPAMAGIAATVGMAQMLSAVGKGMKDGGMVQGPGTGTSDSVPTALSRGEFVTNAASTAANMGLLQQINSSGGRSVGVSEREINVDARPIINNIYNADGQIAAMESARGERAVMNIIGKNGDKIRNMLSR